ncbi:MAG: metal ABC transporter substrate-binding protein [Thermodesulfovibrionales bacterium]|nr:metal ABC transporter substrate-binding protein [Thermodesulfovibrionales bacterium]
MATYLPVYIFAKNVAGDSAGVSLLIPPGTDIHEFQMRPLDIKRLNEADTVFLNGAGLDTHIRERIARKDRAVDTSKGVGFISAGSAPDPHIWLDPSLAAVQVRNIRDAFVEKDPSNRQRYERNAAEYISRLSALDREIKEGLSGLKGRYLITYHEAFNYFARRYGLKPYSLTGPSAESPLPGRMKDVYDIVRHNRVMAIFVEKQFPKDSVERLGRELGVAVCTLDSIESGRPEPDYYERAMRENMKNILRCLKGQ